MTRLIGAEWESDEANGGPCSRGGYYYVFRAVYAVI